MAPAVRRPGPPAAAVDNRVNFGDDSFYTAGGGGIPEGRYVTFYDAVLHQYEKQDGGKVGPEFLAVRVQAYSLDAPTEEPKIGYYSMGGKAILSFMPNVEDEGKSLLAVPNGPATSLNESTNWNLYRKSLIDSGMPVGTFTNDLRAIDGTWVHITNIPEPENRKSFGAATGEAQEERKNKTIAVVSEILDGGAPWEGGGGMPEAAPTTPAATRVAGRIAPKGNGAVVARPPARAAAPSPPARPTAHAAPAAPPAGNGADTDDTLVAAQSALEVVLGGSPDGIGKLVLRTGVFKQAAKSSQEMASAILETYFADDASLNALLGTVGYQVNGPRVVPA